MRLAMLALFAVAAVPRTTSAGAKLCGTSYGNTNIPAGAIGLSRSEGPIKAVIDGLGEHRTHSILANSTFGDGQWFTQATAKAPGLTTLMCAIPLESGQLFHANPGASQLNAGGLYTQYYGGGFDDAIRCNDARCPRAANGGTATPTNAAVTEFYYQQGIEAVTGPPPLHLVEDVNYGYGIQHYFWNSAPYYWARSIEDAAAGYYSLKFPGGIWNWGFGNPVGAQYGLYTYMSMEDSNRGLDMPTASGATNCSTFLGWGQTRFFKQSSGCFTYPGTVICGNDIGDYYNKNTYTNPVITNAANSAWSAVYNQCLDDASAQAGFWDFAWGIGVACSKPDLCAKAANQVLNCWSRGHVEPSAYGACNFTDDGWRAAVAEPNRANAISPDALGGWSGHGYGHHPPYPVWSYDGNHTVYWNGAGNAYGCWD